MELSWYILINWNLMVWTVSSLHYWLSTPPFVPVSIGGVGVGGIPELGVVVEVGVLVVHPAAQQDEQVCGHHVWDLLRKVLSIWKVM